MTVVTLKEAQSNLEKLVHELAPGEEIVIYEHNRAIARLTGAGSHFSARSPRKLGSMAGSVIAMAADFDAPVDDMQDHMF